MHLTLINADNEVWASGMRVISSVLRRAGHGTTMIFAGNPRAPINETTMCRIAELVGDSEIIGASSMSRGSGRAKELIEGLRPLGRLMVWGGMHPTLFPEDCVAHADLVCRGEGEEFMLDLADRVASGQEYKDILNGAYRSNGRTVVNGMRPPISDLDSLPLLDYAFENEYILDAEGSLVPNSGMGEARGNILFSGSRGCNNNCAYCSNSQLKSMYKGNGLYVRKMSVHHFVEAACEYLAMFPQATHFYFTDEDFFARPVEEMEEFSKNYRERVGIPFECMASPRQITDEKVALAAKAGMFQIDVGMESGSERVRREVFDRRVTDEMQMQAANAINKHARDSPLYFLIIGNPYEEREDLIDGLRFVEGMPSPFSLRTYSLVFIPGTRLYQKACEDGIISGIEDSASNLDFLAGLDHKAHDWKRKNLYLNCLLSLMCGRSTRWRVGLIPRGLLPLLYAPRAVDLCERHAHIGESIAGLSRLTNKMHRAVEDSLIAGRAKRASKRR